MRLTGRLLRLAGPSGPMSITRNGSGVPRVQASRFGDLAYGLGWLHAHDRMVQMMLVRILGRGQGAQLLDGSEQMVEIDSFMRRMGFARDAAEQAAELSDAAKPWCEAYCQGVNDYLERERRPLELWLVGYRPDPWTVADSLLTIKLVSYMGLAQSQQSIEKLLAQAAAGGLDLGLLRELVHPHLEGFDPSWVEGVRFREPLVPASVPWMKAVPSFRASNNWAVSGSRTASGSPILANDPHLECDRLPAVWYEAVLSSGEAYAMGATIPGVPGVLIGRNRQAAWGVTYGFMDQIDYFVEDCRDGCFRRGDEWVAFDRREELIRIKGGGEKRLAVHENLHGVLEGDPWEPGRYLCRAWSGARGNVARTADAMVALLAAHDVSEAMAAVRNITISLNWVVADRSGNIGYQQSGVLPRRAEGVSGLYPVPGWDPAYDWRGWVDPSELHRLMNPPEGFVASANEELNPPGGPLAINMPMGDYRARRIRAVLAASEKVGVEEMQALQRDLHSIQATEMMPALRPHLPDSDEGRSFGGWDCTYSDGSREASRFEAIYRELIRIVFGEGGLGRDLVDFLWDETEIFTDYYACFDRILMSEDALWYGGRDRLELVRRAVSAAFPGTGGPGSAEAGLDPPARPRDRGAAGSHTAGLPETSARSAVSAVPRPWGEQRRVMMRNIFFQGKLPAFLGFDHGPVLLRGNRATVLQGAIYRSHGLPRTFAPSIRLVTDLASDEIHTALAGGPSGRRWSRWYTSDVPLWQSGRYKILRA